MDLIAKLGVPRDKIYPFVRDSLMKKDLDYVAMLRVLFEYFEIKVTDSVVNLIALSWYDENDSVQWVWKAEHRLQDLRRSGVQLVLITNTTAPGWNQANRKLKLEEYFHKLFLSCHARRTKPNPEVWIEVQSWYPDLSPSQFYMVGDSEEDDLRVPRSMGWNTYLVQSSHDLKGVVDDVLELWRVLGIGRWC